MSEPKPVKRLTLKQRTFVDKYIEHNGNATAAARDAGYNATGNSLEVIAHHNVMNPYIEAAIAARLEAAGITADMVIAELGRVAFADWKDFVKIKYGRDGHMIEANMDMASKVRSLELLGKHFKLFTEKIEVSQEEVIRTLVYLPPEQQHIPLPAEVPPVSVDDES